MSEINKDDRAGEIKYIKVVGDWPMYIFSGLIIIGFFMTIICLFRFELIPINKELIIYTIGALQSAFITVVSYFFGSSKGSFEKNKMLDKQKKI